jgi:hypothetical protein
MLVKSKLALLILTMLLLSSALTTACRSQPAGSQSEPAAHHSHSMAGLERMPAQVREAAIPVQEAYQFAVANPDILSQLPCYCGCGGMGHDNNYDCYVAATNENGWIEYDNHALNCTICIDITQDAMRLLDEGQSMTEIKSYVDNTYARYGPSNMH